jgi:acyl-CoA synthetase (AMP-forming)/AMP-acid ligase II
MDYAKLYKTDLDGLADWSKLPDIDPCVPALLAHGSKAWPDNDLIIFDDERVTYGEADVQSAILARQLLAAGVAKGTRIGIIFPNSPAFLITWLAITRIGAVVVPISTLSPGAEILRTARHADLHMIITTDQFMNHKYVEAIAASFTGIDKQRAPYALDVAPFLRAVWVWGKSVPSWATAVDLSAKPAISTSLLAEVEMEVTPSDLISIIYTSGSTADPKGVMHTHGNFLRQGARLAATYPYKGDDRIYAPMPFFWVGGITLTILNAMHLGATVLGSAKSGPALMDLVERERTTYMIAWPHIAKAFIADPSFKSRDWSHMRGGGLIDVLAPEKAPKNQYMGQALGMSETCGPHTASPINIPDHLIGSFGPTMPGMRHRIVNVETGKDADHGETGELLVRGNALMLGLVKRERSETFDEDGWYATGDLCSFREGHLFFHGRLDDMIKTAGANVSPREVEAVLMAQPGVAQASVSSVPDDEKGAVVGAIVVPKPGETLDPAKLREAAAKVLSAYKVPKVFVIMEASKLPMMSSSKLDRRALLKILADAHPSGKK